VEVPVVVVGVDMVYVQQQKSKYSAEEAGDAVITATPAVSGNSDSELLRSAASRRQGQTTKF
jgi:hypothetical protein